MNKPLPDEPRSYVVRVYRRTARWFAGYVEDVRSGRVQQFRSAAELWSAIGGPQRKPKPKLKPQLKSIASRKESRS